MSIWGKVLAVFNVLAAIGFLVVAGMDYNKRQSWAYSHFQHQLVVNGLPMDKDDDTGRLPGRTISEQFGKDANKVLFAPNGGPMTQNDAVAGVVDVFKKGVNSAADIAAKKNFIATHLLPELTRADERDDVIRELQMLKDDAGVEALVKRFEAIAEQVKKGDKEAKRRAIADLIYNFEYSDTWQKYTQSVVGLEQYLAAAERQAGRLRDMVARDRRNLQENQAAFVAQYQATLPELTVLAAQLDALNGKLSEMKDQVQKHTALLNARKTEAAKLRTDLNEQKQAEAKELAALNALQKELFSVQQDVFKAQERNQQLERDLRAKETGK